jgi:hypothetical protein
MADMLRLRVSIGVREGCSDWTVLDDDLFRRLTNIRMMITVGSGPPESLINAYVIETRADFSNRPGQSVLNVVAMDPTVLMNLEEKVRPWPNMADSDIATVIFGEYGFTPQVKQTQPSRQEVDYTVIQRGTDIQFLRQLAERNGYECYVEMNPLTGLIEGHFHPPRLEQSPQGVLSVNLGEATNVNSFNARYDMLRPTTVQVTGLDIETQSDQPAQAESQALAELVVKTLQIACENNDMTRAGVMKAAESIQGFSPSVFLPGISVSFSSTDHRAIEALQPVRIEATGTLTAVGDLISLE